jgi:hypothetical protein
LHFERLSRGSTFQDHAEFARRPFAALDGKLRLAARRRKGGEQAEANEIFFKAFHFVWRINTRDITRF